VRALDVPRVRHRYVDVEVAAGTVRVFVREAGPTDGATLLLLHGFPSGSHQALIVWDRNDPIFPEPGAHAYLADLPQAELHTFDTGNFALEENLPEIAPLIAAFLGRVST
jgi:pimeloyl-ACP methyl ester carboxylesterase